MWIAPLSAARRYTGFLYLFVDINAIFFSFGFFLFFFLRVSHSRVILFDESRMRKNVVIVHGIREPSVYSFLFIFIRVFKRSIGFVNDYVSVAEV